MNYFDTFINFWIPILKRQLFRAFIEKDYLMIFAIKENIYKNVHLTATEKQLIARELKIYSLKEVIK